MSNILIIGGSSGFGEQIAFAMAKGPTLREFYCTSRGEVDITSGTWLADLKTYIDEQIGSPEAVSSVIIVAYDRDTPTDNAQLRAARALYDLYKKKEGVKFCVIGDMIHHRNRLQSIYTADKNALFKQFQEWAEDSERDCSLMLFEPKINDSKSAEAFGFLHDSLEPGDYFCVTAHIR
jgi:hypothetical protein